ncbi:MAG: hypothetical protein ABI878_14485 [Acidobacteriota bacterium]
MLRKTFVIVFVAAIAAAFALGAVGKTDPVSGDWHVVFSIAGQTAEGTMKLKLDGDKITGTVETAHTGPGTLSNGKWADGKMSFTADFPKHESIDITGAPKDGKLSGDFKTEGMGGTWLGTKE